MSFGKRSNIVKQLVLVLMLSCFSMAFSQSECHLSTNKVMVEDTSNQKDWLLYLEVEHFKVEYIYQQCPPEIGGATMNYFIRITNYSDSTLSVNWDTQLFVNNICKTCSFQDEYHTSLTLLPQEIREGDCNIFNQQELKLFVRFVSPGVNVGNELSSFKLGTFQYHFD